MSNVFQKIPSFQEVQTPKLNDPLANIDRIVLFVQRSTRIKMKLFFFILIATLIQPVRSSECHQSNASSSNSSCSLCFTNGSFQSCLVTGTTYNQSSECKSRCCAFDYTDTQPSDFCKPELQSEQSDNTSLMIILISVFVGAPILFCIISCICNYFYERRGKQDQVFSNHRNQLKKRQSTELPITAAMTLEDYIMEDISPYHMKACQQCAICQEVNCNIRTKCKHAFHSECLREWFLQNFKCPTCSSRERWFNPIFVYCSKCSTARKMVMLSNRMSIDQRIEWKQLPVFLCDFCKPPLESGSIELITIDEQIIQMPPNSPEQSEVKQYKMMFKEGLIVRGDKINEKTSDSSKKTANSTPIPRPSKFK